MTDCVKALIPHALAAAVRILGRPVHPIRVHRTHKHNRIVVEVVSGQQRLVVKQYAGQDALTSQRYVQEVTALRLSAQLPVLVAVEPATRTLIMEWQPGRVPGWGWVMEAGSPVLLRCLQQMRDELKAPGRSADHLAHLRWALPLAVKAAEREGARKTAVALTRIDVPSVATVLRQARHAPCHRDLQRTNLLRHGGQLRLLDAESVGQDVPILDVTRLALDAPTHVDVAARVRALKVLAEGLSDQLGDPLCSELLDACLVFWAVTGAAAAYSGQVRLVRLRAFAVLSHTGSLRNFAS